MTSAGFPSFKNTARRPAAKARFNIRLKAHLRLVNPSSAMISLPFFSTYRLTKTTPRPNIIRTSLNMNATTVSLKESPPKGIIIRLRAIIKRPATAAMPVSLVTLNLNSFFILALVSSLLRMRSIVRIRSKCQETLHLYKNTFKPLAYFTFVLLSG